MSNQRQGKTWPERAEGFAKIRAQIKQVLALAQKTGESPLDVAEIAREFKLRFRYLPTIERRLRELVDNGAVKRIGGAVPKYELIT